jgi:hypothetical protein
MTDMLSTVAMMAMVTIKREKESFPPSDIRRAINHSVFKKA